MTKDIEVATRHGPTTITATATIVPQLWVHPGIGEAGWTVSQLPSGGRVAWGVASRAAALCFVAEVAPLTDRLGTGPRTHGHPDRQAESV